MKRNPPAGAYSGVLPGGRADAAADDAAHTGRVLRHRARALTQFALCNCIRNLYKLHIISIDSFRCFIKSSLYRNS